MSSGPINGPISSQPISDAVREKRERVFLVLAGFFLCAMTMLNILGITRFVQIGPYYFFMHRPSQ
jgi:hypothetical protein